MSLRFAVLGLLNDRPSSGYDLTHRFASGIGAYAWDAKHSQIYPELKRLLSEGLIEIAQQGARGRTTYAITDQGRVALRDWLLSPPAGHGGVRNEFVLRLFLLPALEADEAKVILARTIEFAEEQIGLLTAEYEDLMASRGDSVLGHGGLAAQYGLHVYRATIDWARWAIEKLDYSAAGGADSGA